jgi:hypothetical protein
MLLVGVLAAEVASMVDAEAAYAPFGEQPVYCCKQQQQHATMSVYYTAGMPASAQWHCRVPKKFSGHRLP